MQVDVAIIFRHNMSACTQHTCQLGRFRQSSLAIFLQCAWQHRCIINDNGPRQLRALLFAVSLRPELWLERCILNSEDSMATLPERRLLCSLASRAARSGIETALSALQRGVHLKDAQLQAREQSLARDHAWVHDFVCWPRQPVCQGEAGCAGLCLETRIMKPRRKPSAAFVVIGGADQQAGRRGAFFRYESVPL